METLRQKYDEYTAEDFLVWDTLYRRQIKNLEGNICAEYLKGLETIGFTADCIPDFKEVNAILFSHTGWGLTVVANIAPLKDFFSALYEKKFTATTWLRKLSQLDYIEEPDMFHDVFGHVPLLVNTPYTSFFKGMAEIALRHIDDQQFLELLGRIYWFTIEFGLIREGGKLKIYGAGIISSFGETNHCLKEKVEVIPFDILTIIHTPYRNDQIQNTYFVIDSYQQLYQSVSMIEEKILATMERGVVSGISGNR